MNGIKSNDDKKLNICLLLSYPHNPHMPIIGITEIYSVYGEYMPRFGHKMTWIAPSQKKIRQVQEEFFNKVRVYVVPYYESSVLLVKIFNKLLFAFREARLVADIFKKETYDIIQARNSVIEGLVAIYIKRRYKVPFVFQYSFPTGAYKYRTSRLRRWVGKLEGCIMNIILREADLILPIGKLMQEDLTRDGISESNMIPLPSAVDLDLFSQRVSGDAIRSRYNLGNSPVVIYVGLMDELRHLGIVIRAFARVKEERANAKLLMVGDGSDIANLKRLANELGVSSNIVFTGQVSYFDVPKFIAASDLGLVPVPPLPIYRVSVSTKLCEYMAMAKPAVANEEILDHKEVIEESGGGILVPFTPEAFAQAMIELLDNPHGAQGIGRKGREWVMKNRSYEVVARQLEERYFELLEHSCLAA